LNIWVLSHLESSPGTQRFLDAAHRRGHEAQRVHPLDLELLIDAQLGLGYRGEPRELPDVAFTRMGATSPPASLNALLQLQALGVPVINDPRALWTTRDKVRCSLTLASVGLPVPRTIVPGRQLAPGWIEAQLGPPPWVVKRPEGCKGEAVFLVKGEAEIAAHTSDASQAPVLVQRFVAESSGVDLRVLVAGDRVLGAMRRRSSTGDFRSNLHQGGRGEPVEVSDEVGRVALAAATVLGLGVAGVDLLESDDGPLLLEVNGSPGLAGIEDATGTNVSGAIVDYLEERVAV
jgi:ribosomal protein S6--L-glutamate ligase